MPLREAEALEPVLPELLGVHSRDPGVSRMLIPSTEQQSSDPCSSSVSALGALEAAFGEAAGGRVEQRKAEKRSKAASLDAMAGQPLESHL